MRYAPGMESTDPKSGQGLVVRGPGDEGVREALEKLNSAGHRKHVRFVLAAMSSVPWVGGLIGAAASLHGEQDQSKVNVLQQQWLEEHSARLRELVMALTEVMARLEKLGEQARERVESDAYLALVRKGFRVWDQSDTQEKRRLIQKLLASAGASLLTPDDLVRLFIEWIDRYHEAHFAVIREIYKNPGSTRSEIWEAIHGAEVREDSAEADLFRLLISDLSLGRVIRQERGTDGEGRFLRKARTAGRGAPSRVMKSAFDDKEEYVLTSLGEQFVHYVMDEVVPRIGPPSAQSVRGS